VIDLRFLSRDRGVGVDPDLWRNHHHWCCRRHVPESGGTKRDGSMSLRVERFGSIATGMQGAWFAFFILVGLYTTFFLK